MRSFRQLVLILAVLAAAPAHANPITMAGDALRVEQAVVVSSLATQSAVFAVTFSFTPDFVSRDSYDRPATQIQFFVDSDVPLTDLSRFYEAVRGLYPSDGLHLIRTGDTAVASEVTVRDIEAFYSGTTGWGPVTGNGSFTGGGPTVTFTLPLAFFDATDGTFWWALEVYQYGALQESAAYGRAAVSEPGSWLLLLGISLGGLRSLRKR